MSDAPGTVLVEGGGVVVRYATLADVPAVVAQAGRYTASVFSGTLSQSAYELDPFATAQATPATEDSRLLIATLHDVVVGVLSVAALTHPATRVRFACDLFWWMEPPLWLRARVGIRLLQAFEDWAVLRRAPLLIVTSGDDRDAAFLTAVGFDATRGWARRTEA
jgi:hypothetical protein